MLQTATASLKVGQRLTLSTSLLTDVGRLQSQRSLWFDRSSMLPVGGRSSLELHRAGNAELRVNDCLFLVFGACMMVGSDALAEQCLGHEKEDRCSRGGTYNHIIVA